MCLKLKNGEKNIEVADAPIICYKVLRDRNGDYFSPFYDFEYVVGEEFYDIHSIEDVLDDYYANYGFHTYERLEDAKRMKKILEKENKENKYIVCACKIPMGARYYSGIVETGFVEEVSKDGSLPPGYVSSRIIINEIL